MNRTWWVSVGLVCGLGVGCQAHDPGEGDAKPPEACCLKTEVVTTGSLDEVMKGDLPPNVAMSGQGNGLVLGGGQSVHSDGPFVASDGCRRDDVIAVVLKGRDAVKACVARHAEPGEVVSIEVRWELGTSGEPESLLAYVDRDGLEEAAACVEEEMRGWRYEPLELSAYCEVSKTFEVTGE